MNRVFCAALMFSVSFTLCRAGVLRDSTAVDSTSRGDLTVIVKDLENDDGMVRIALSQSEEDYNSRGTPFRRASVPINERVARHTFTDIPYGEYAVKIFHDEDGDKELDTGLFGIPTEAYGFSNNASASFGPPDFEDARFLFNKKILTIEISVD
ncbi:MAG: DUF2141 domain-containing protein [Bacteroidota bacterium]